MTKKNHILDYAVSLPFEGGPSFSLINRLIRLSWNLVWFVAASWTPPFMYPWRWLLLRLYGAKMAWPSDVRGSAKVWYPPHLEMEQGALIAENVICYNQEKISLMKKALVSRGAHLCAGTHDIDDPNFQLVAKRITIGVNAWVASEAFVGPGVTIGSFAVLGARSVAFSDVGDSMVFIGNPARHYRSRNLNSKKY